MVQYTSETGQWVLKMNTVSLKNKQLEDFMVFSMHIKLKIALIFGCFNIFMQVIKNSKYNFQDNSLVFHAIDPIG
jgi:hypothetical protein